jgi:hypothetical protein
LLAIIVNDDAYFLGIRGGLAIIASKLAPTGGRGGSTIVSTPEIIVGASLLAMVVNDDAYFLGIHGGLAIIASKLAPTGDWVVSQRWG